MAYVLKTNLADKRNYGGQRATSKIKYLVIHYTANDGDTDESEARYFKNNIPKASAHYFVDDDSVTQSVPDNFVAYAVGGTKIMANVDIGGGTMYGVVKNSNSISVELCDTIKDGKPTLSEKTKENAIAFIKSLMIKHGIDINHVYRHFDVTGKKCPSYFVDNKAWANFKLELQSTFNNSAIAKINTAANTVYTQNAFIEDVCKILNVETALEAYKKVVTISKTENKNNPLVTPLERYMKSLGYYSGSIEQDAGKTPSFGPGMERAIQKYQTYVVKYTKAKNIDGIISAKGNTWKKLLKLV